MNLAVNVISDVICPWCYIGKKRLERAIASFERQQVVRVRWLPFQLNPTMPRWLWLTKRIAVSCWAMKNPIIV
jgi:predicted DsbA family dithiol-disulfide isomerase